METFQKEVLADILNDVTFRPANGRLDWRVNEHVCNWDRRVHEAIANPDESGAPVMRFGDLETLFDGTDEPKAHAFLRVLFDSELTLSELSGFDLSRIEFGSYELPDGSKRRFGYGVISLDGSGAKQAFLIGHEAAEALRLYVESATVWLDWCGVLTFGDAGSGISHSVVTRMLVYWCRECNIPAFTTSEFLELRQNSKLYVHEEEPSDFASQSRCEYDEDRDNGVSYDEGPNYPEDAGPDCEIPF